MTLTITEFEQFMDDYEAVNHFKLMAADMGLEAAEKMAVSRTDIWMGFFTQEEAEELTKQARINAMEAAHLYNNYIALCKEL